MAERMKEVVNYGIEDRFLMEDLNQRKLYINYGIDESIIDNVVYHILRFNAEDKGLEVEERIPIKLYLTSCGGSVVDGFELIDVIIASKTPVYTINLGYQYSMGFLIGLAGHKKFGSKNATYLMHDGSNFVYNSSSKVKDQMLFQDEQESHIKKYILSRSRLTSEEYDEKLRVEWYMFSDIAKTYGFCDYIIGVDCDIDEIV